MNKTLQELRDECLYRGLSLSPTQKYQRKDYVNLLAEQSLHSMDISWGLEKRLTLESPMLCFPFKNMRPEQQDECLNSPNWVAEEKFNGCRMVITYHKEEGLKFFGRSVSVEDYLPIDYTEKILLKTDTLTLLPRGFMRPEDFLWKDGPAFVIDAEVVLTPGATIDTSIYRKARGQEIFSELNACVAILSLDTDVSHQVQRIQASLEFRAFDLMYIDEENWMPQQLLKRKIRLRKLIEELSKAIPITLSKLTISDKEAFFKETVQRGGEGIVLKNLAMSYVPTTSRRRDTQVKLKRSMGLVNIEDIDAYVIGSVKATEGKAWEDYIGGLRFAVRLRSQDGTEVEHEIATVTGIPLEKRKAMTVELKGEGPVINPGWLGTVFTINGQSITSRNKKLAHAMIDWSNEPYRPDKNPDDCVMDEGFLLSQIM